VIQGGFCLLRTRHMGRITTPACHESVVGPAWRASLPSPRYLRLNGMPLVSEPPPEDDMDRLEALRPPFVPGCPAFQPPAVS
jgi:hypothetical protein